VRRKDIADVYVEPWTPSLSENVDDGSVSCLRLRRSTAINRKKLLKQSLKGQRGGWILL
jgi:hypothetical protein